MVQIQFVEMSPKKDINNPDEPPPTVRQYIEDDSKLSDIAKALNAELSLLISHEKEYFETKNMVVVFSAIDLAHRFRLLAPEWVSEALSPGIDQMFRQEKVSVLPKLWGLTQKKLGSLITKDRTWNDVRVMQFFAEVCKFPRKEAAVITAAHVMSNPVEGARRVVSPGTLLKDYANLKPTKLSPDDAEFYRIGNKARFDLIDSINPARLSDPQGLISNFNAFKKRFIAFQKLEEDVHSLTSQKH